MFIKAVHNYENAGEQVDLINASEFDPIRHPTEPHGIISLTPEGFSDGPLPGMGSGSRSFLKFRGDNFDKALELIESAIKNGQNFLDLSELVVRDSEERLEILHSITEFADDIEKNEI